MNRTCKLATALLIALTGATFSAGNKARASDVFHWVQYVSGGVELRAVTDASECPKAEVDGAPATMRIRATPGENYPVRVCALLLPRTIRSAKIDGRPVGLPKSTINRI